jgi:glycosyltransferase involved in cell wall biosynthesis
MRVMVVTSDVPFVRGGHIVIAEALVSKLKEAGHEAQLWCTPQNKFGKQISAYLANYFTDLSESGDGKKIDAIISIRYPAYAVRHPFHVCWLNHRMREYYDLWGDFKSKISFLNRMKETVRRFIIHRIDKYLFKHNVLRLYAQSRNIQNRLRQFGNIQSEVLYPPAIPRNYHCNEYGDFIMMPSRLYFLKRLDLGIKAIALCQNKELSLMIVGEGPHIEHLQKLVVEQQLMKRVIFTGWVSDEELADLYAKCRAVLYPAYDEDYGLVTLEAFSSSKAFITCRDSGGTTELVDAEIDGLIVEPEPKSIAEAIDKLADRQLAEKMGAQGYQKSLLFTWEKTITALLSP